jgi:hypothetical protein
MPQNMTTMAPILKEVYEGSLNDQLNNETYSYNRLLSKSNGIGTKPMGGKYVEFAIHTGRNSGIGARNELEALPNAGKQSAKAATLNLKYQYAGIELSGQTFELATKDYQTFANAVDMEMERIKDDLAKDRNRQYFGNGNGRVATVTAVSGQDITFDSIQHIQDSEVLDIVIAATGVSHGTAVVVSVVNETTNVVTVTGTLSGVIAGDIAVRTGSWNREWTGLDAIISDTTTLYGLAPATTRVWKSHVTALNGAISEAVMKRLNDRITRAGGKTTAIITTPGVERAYWQLLAASRRFVDPKTYAGGYTGVEFNAGSSGPIPILTDIDAPAGKAYFLNEKEINLYRPHGFKFMDRDGSMWKQKTDASGRYDAYLASLYEYSELGTHRRNTHGVITGITEDAAV